MKYLYADAAHRPAGGPVAPVPLLLFRPHPPGFHLGFDRGYPDFDRIDFN